MGKVVLILAVTAVGLGLLSLHLVNRLREGDAAVAELKTQVAGLQEQLAQRRAEPPPVFEVAATAELAQPPQAAPAPSKDAVKPAPSQATAAIAPAMPGQLSREDRIRMMREQRERQRQLMQDPEYRDAMRLQARTNLARQYPGVIQELNLDPLQADEFFGMLAEQQMRISEQMEPMWFAEDGVTPDSAAFQERQRKIQQTVTEMQRKGEAELASRFGQDKLQAWKEYQSTAGQRYQLEHMRTTLAAQGLPLGDDVNKPMLKALAAAQRAEVDEYAASVGRNAVAGAGRTIAFEAPNFEQQIETTKKRNQRTLDAISPYLTFEQREAIEKEQAAQLKMMEAQMRMMKARGNANASGLTGVYTDGNAQLMLTPP